MRDLYIPRYLKRGKYLLAGIALIFALYILIGNFIYVETTLHVLNDDKNFQLVDYNIDINGKNVFQDSLNFGVLDYRKISVKTKMGINKLEVETHKGEITKKRYVLIWTSNTIVIDNLPRCSNNRCINIQNRLRPFGYE